MKIQAIYLDGSHKVDEISQDNSRELRKEFLRESLKSPIGDVNFLVTNSEMDFLVREKIIPHNSALKIVSISGVTKGALATALLAIDKVQADRPVLLVPTNSIVKEIDLRNFISKMIIGDVSAGALLVKSKNPNFSYARIHKDQVIEFVEKRVVGDMATTGVFFFKEKALLVESAKWAFVNSQVTNNQYYVAPSLNYVLTSGNDVGYTEVDPRQYKHI